MLRGTFGGAPPEFLQSILQAVAGQMMGTGAVGVQPQTTTAPTTASETTGTTETSQAQETTVASASSTHTATSSRTNINSQARSNTQTHPTTSTQTRSTPRPHVHLAQHTMQGFDPFLPCNSHHIRRRRIGHVAPNAASTPVAGVTNETENQNNNQTNNPLYNILQGFLRTVGNHVGRMQRERPATQETANTTARARTGATTEGQTNTAETLPPFSTFLSHNLVSIIYSTRFFAVPDGVP